MVATHSRWLVVLLVNMQTAIIPRMKMERLKCFACKNFLSVPPIFYTTDNNYRCGRCAFLDTKLGSRAALFEEIVISMKFPCIFPGCMEDIEWGRIPKHEQICPKQVVECPFCSETGFKIDSLQTHFDSSHKSFKFSQLIWKMDNIETRTSITFETVGKYSFVVGIFQNTDCIAFCVNSLFHDNSNFMFDATLRSSSSSITLYDNSINPFFEAKECKKCWIGTCENPHHNDYVAKIREKLFRKIPSIVKKNYLRNFLGQSLDTITISINIKNRTIEKERINNERQVLECSICQKVMSPPIFLCLTGHSACSNCRSALNQCQTCKRTWTNARNYSLEHFSEKVILACDNKFRGCEFEGLVKDIREHEITCPKNKKLKQ
ncbi:hypothetical protein JTB14_029336 [Gonioctena quinquepunctata]|nr:hypothetical protein JTB14_029336 [Gonioctena quinquepunctata]